MTDTRLILSAANGVKRGPQRESERNSAGGGFCCALCCVPATPTYFLPLLLSLSPLSSFTTSLLTYIERKNVNRARL